MRTSAVTSGRGLGKLWVSHLTRRKWSHRNGGDQRLGLGPLFGGPGLSQTPSPCVLYEPYLQPKHRGTLQLLCRKPCCGWLLGVGFLPLAQGGDIFCSFCRSLGTQGNCLAGYASVGPLRRACGQRHCGAAQNALLGPSWLSWCPALPPRKGWPGQEGCSLKVCKIQSPSRCQGGGARASLSLRLQLAGKDSCGTPPPKILPPWSGWFSIPVLKDRWSLHLCEGSPPTV